MDIKSLLISLIDGIYEADIAVEAKTLINELIRTKALGAPTEGRYKLDSNYRAGKIDVSSNGTGYLDTFGDERKDLIVEPQDLMGANRGDIVVARRVFAKSKRVKAKVVLIAQRGFATYVGLSRKEKGGVVVRNIKTALPIAVAATQKSLKQLPPDTLLKIDSTSGAIREVLGVLSDPLMDEKISLTLFDKEEFFSKQSEEEAKSFGNEVDKSLYPNRVDLTDTPFCTIDPNDAKDFDDAVYFDEKNYTIYVAIADVSEYVYPFGSIDKEAEKRGFSIYFPHKSIPMLPRVLSENICSLKPNVDRLVFGFKIVLDRATLEPKSEELFEGVINSKKRYTYELVDRYIDGSLKAADKADKQILSWLMPLFALTQKLRAERMINALDFHSSETRMSLDEKQNILSTKIESETPSHSLIEECMLLANKAAAKRIKYGIFRTHEAPSFEKINRLLDDLSLIGIEAKSSPQIPALIRNIQAKADESGIRKDVDKLIIKSQKQASYTPDNKGHFGLGFEIYSHFTSPIRRYSDLVLHRLLKSQLRNEERLSKFQLENIEAVCEKLSSLERESDKVAWDFMDRKFARWAAERLGECFTCKVTELGRVSISLLDDELKGARVFLMDDDLELFERVGVRILGSDIASAKITGEVVKRFD
ncbi:MAG: ribonuclease R [Campylobacteraceae bacterium]|jgi:ribonuclease R|nr:ribonuclease R [Campylobacteraceae bacterium]